MSEQVLETYAAERLARINSARSFQFEGVTFHYKAAIPVSVLDAFLNRDGSVHDIETLCDLTARACLENPEAWDLVRSPSHEPMILDFAGIVWLTDQIVTRASGLPTERPDGSSNGPQTPTAGSSAAGSPSTAAAPSA